MRQPLTDPRTIITPDAFSVAPELLGTPLAPPIRRLGAILVDLLVVGIITLITGSVKILVGVVAAVLLFRVATRRSGAGGSDALTWVFRVSVGCLGLFILLVTVAVALVVRAARSGQLEQVAVSMASRAESPDSGPGLADLVMGLGDTRDLRAAPDAAAAEEAATRLASRLRSAGVPSAEVAEILESVAPAGADWRGDLEGIVERALERAARPPEPAFPALPETPGEGEPEAGQAAAPVPLPSSPAEALEVYAGWLRQAQDDPAAPMPEAVAEAREVLLAALAGDTLEALEARAAASEVEVRRARRDLERTREQLSRARAERGIRAWLRSLAEDLGVAFGWGTVYLTAVLTWWNGRTVGKRLFGIRVVRLDGSRLNWWLAFERVGGYAAGFATGLLGFAQVLWDPNRQAIHDRIAGTVVVLDGAQPLPGHWQRAATRLTKRGDAP